MNNFFSQYFTNSFNADKIKQIDFCLRDNRMLQSQLTALKMKIKLRLKAINDYLEKIEMLQKNKSNSVIEFYQFNLPVTLKNPLINVFTKPFTATLCFKATDCLNSMNDFDFLDNNLEENSKYSAINSEVSDVQWNLSISNSSESMHKRSNFAIIKNKHKNSFNQYIFSPKKIFKNNKDEKTNATFNSLFQCKNFSKIEQILLKNIDKIEFFFGDKLDKLDLSKLDYQKAAQKLNTSEIITKSKSLIFPVNIYRVLLFCVNKNNVNTSFWKEEEIRLLERLIEKYGIENFTVVHQFLSRNYIECIRFYSLIFKKPWSALDDLKLAIGIQAYEDAYVDISLIVFQRKRSELQCRERYVNILNPRNERNGLKESELLQMVFMKLEGKGWSWISQHFFKNKTDNKLLREFYKLKKFNTPLYKQMKCYFKSVQNLKKKKHIFKINRGD